MSRFFFFRRIIRIDRNDDVAHLASETSGIAIDRAADRAGDPDAPFKTREPAFTVARASNPEKTPADAVTRIPSIFCARSVAWITTPWNPSSDTRRFDPPPITYHGMPNDCASSTAFTISSPVVATKYNRAGPPIFKYVCAAIGSSSKTAAKAVLKSTTCFSFNAFILF